MKQPPLGTKKCQGNSKTKGLKKKINCEIISVRLPFSLSPSTVVIKLSVQEFKMLLECLTTHYYYWPQNMLWNKMQSFPMLFDKKMG